AEKGGSTCCRPSHRRHRAEELGRFLDPIEELRPEALDVLLVRDNHTAGKTALMQRWLARSTGLNVGSRSVPEDDCGATSVIGWANSRSPLTVPSTSTTRTRSLSRGPKQPQRSSRRRAMLSSDRGLGHPRAPCRTLSETAPGPRRTRWRGGAEGPRA